MNDRQHSASPALTTLGAKELVQRIARGAFSAQDVVEAHIARIEEDSQRLNAVVVPMFNEARRAAEAADLAQRRDEPLGPLHGAPITLKECFHVAGTPHTIGLTNRANDLADADAPLVRQLRRAGAIVLGKTNVPQLMLLHETDNPLYGRTNNPWDVERTPGGSSGGEGAVIAAGGSSLGLGSDMGGSIRLPAHFCGIHGFKPTTGRLTLLGKEACLRGMQAIAIQPGPLARRVEDLALAMRVLCDRSHGPPPSDAAPVEWRDPSGVQVDRLRVGYWIDDGYFPPSPAVARAVREAAEALSASGAHVEEIQPPDMHWAMRLYFAAVSADGGADIRAWLQGSEVDWRVRRLLRLAGLPRLSRRPIAAALRALGQDFIAELVLSAGARSAADYWRLQHEINGFRRHFIERMERERLDLVLTPPHALAAMPHELSADLMPAAAPSFLFNVLGFPTGVVAATRVKAGEEGERPETRDRAMRAARQTEAGSESLPVGVQVAGRHWCDHAVLAAMASLEAAFRRDGEYPQSPTL